MSVVVYDAQEIQASRNIRFSSDGLSGTRSYRVYSWDHIEDNSWGPASATEVIPTLGSRWTEDTTSALWYLVVTDMQFQETEAGTGIVTVEYTSSGLYVSDGMRTDLNFGLDAAYFGPGWYWETSGKPVSNTQEYYIPTATYTISMKLPAFPKAAVQATLNKVNSATWHGFAAETLLFTGCQTSCNRTTDGTLTTIEVQFTFDVKPFSHNYAFREPVPKTDSQGNPLYYHHINNAPKPYSDFYVADTDPKYGTMAYVDAGGWDKPYITGSGPYAGQTVYLHQLCNFTTELGIPDLVDPDPSPSPSPTPEPEVDDEEE